MERADDGRRAQDAPAPAAASPRAAADALGELLAQVGRGSAPAFERLYNEVAGSVFGIAMRVVRDAHLAEDVAQEALVEVWRLAPRYRPDAGSARAWILTIAHRRAVDRVRAEAAHAARLSREQSPGVVAESGPDAVVDVMYAQWQAARVKAGFAALTALQREALELAFYKGYTHREVAEALQIPLGTAKARLRDGLIKMRDMWEVEA